MTPTLSTNSLRSVRNNSSAPRSAFIRFFLKALVGEYGLPSLVFLGGYDHDLCCSLLPSRLLLAFTPTRRFSIIQIFSNMRSYTNLAVLVLAAAAVAPGLSAPTQYRYENLLV
jgi:hypothetical protein